MSESYPRLKHEQLSLEYFDEGFKCRLNPSFEDIHGDGLARYTLRINFPENLDKIFCSDKSDFLYALTIERIVTDRQEILKDGSQKYKAPRIGYALPDPSSRMSPRENR
ncbi:uncharacterized protein L199_000624 [Kwoniella botswanensis]|uniref:uncharacterized protein n=1 Tax=Kwoniella botswanensis TaxID=1268659 RepID=UPI00315C8613